MFEYFHNNQGDIIDRLPLGGDVHRSVVNFTHYVQKRSIGSGAHDEYYPEQKFKAI